MPLVVSRKLNEVKISKFSFTILAYIVIGVFVLSLSHKMIGVELLNCCQIAYLSNSFYL
jgi:hypothetical protein